MKIVLDSTLKLVPPSTPFFLTDRVEPMARELVRRTEIKNVKSLIGGTFHPDTVGLKQGWLGMLADCYSRHEKVRLAPHDLWFIVMSEIAKEVNRAPETYRGLFTSSLDKQTIMVPTGDVTSIDPTLLIRSLVSKINVPMGMFLPPLSTATPDVNAALAATFCDMVQSYYNYGTFMCGIPEIEVTGTPEDWALLISCVADIRARFTSAGCPDQVVGYLNRVGRVFSHICADVATQQPDLDFWKGIFTTKNIGSGGELQLTGWVKDLYLEPRPGNKLENFTTSVGIVPYFNSETKREFTAIYGAFGVLRSPEGFLYSSYDHIVLERNPA